MRNLRIYLPWLIVGIILVGGSAKMMVDTRTKVNETVRDLDLGANRMYALETCIEIMTEDVVYRSELEELIRLNPDLKLPPSWEKRLRDKAIQGEPPATSLTGSE